MGFIHEAAQRPFLVAAVSGVVWLVLGLIVDYILKRINHPQISKTQLNANGIFDIFFFVKVQK